MSFKDLGLKGALLRAIKEKGYTTPSPIQEKAIPHILAGKDVLASAQTGTGKTAGFTLPVIQYLSETKHPKYRPIRALVLTPTRELAAQVYDNVKEYSSYLNIRSAVVFGGVKAASQIATLKRGVDVLVATPGRLLDLHNQKVVSFKRIDVFILDEADRMLDMGFFPDILWVIEKMPNRNQNLLFSATFPDEVLNITEEIMTNAEHVMSDDLEVDIPEIDLYAVRIGRGNKLWVLGRLIANMSEEGQMLIFSNTKRMVDVIVERLGKFQMEAVGIHGDMPQNKREKLLSKFKSGDEKIVVATDVAARGLDVDGITIVVNYDLPDDTEAFVHRIGRTGRMGRKGEAWSLVSKEDKGSLQKISSTWGLEIPFVETPELPDGMSRDPVRKRDDWDEVADSFGMVRINLKIGIQDSTKRALSDWIVSQAKIPEIIIGEINQSDESTEIEVHVAKVAYVIDVIKAREYNGRKLKPEIIEA